MDTPSCTSIEGCEKAQATPTPDAPATEEEPPPPEPELELEPEPEPVCEEGDYGADTTCGEKCVGEKAKCQCAQDGTLLELEPVCTCTCGD